jgi:hypothetical protein
LKKIESDKDCPVFVLEKGEKFDLEEYWIVGLGLKPIAIMIKPDGTLDDKPSFLFVLQDAQGNCTAAQISVQMFNPVFNALREMGTEI